jgi:D-alanine-D-alanine ligase
MKLQPESQRVLVLMHETLVPPDDITGCTPQQLDEFRTEYDVVRQLKASGHDVRCLGLADNLAELTRLIQDWRPHIAFNLAEEFQGQVSYDQHLVAYLELLKQPYTGCNPRGLTLSRDKALAKRILMAHDIVTPKFLVIDKGRKVPNKHGLHYPLFVKSVVDDASYGIAKASLVHDAEALAARVAFIHDHIGSSALVEEFVVGRELYVAVIGNERPRCYPVWEMDFGTAMRDGVRIATRKAKWDRAFRERHSIGSHAAKLAPAVQKTLQRQALAAYRALLLTGYARMDFRLSDTGELYLLEANANPCLTEAEDFARSAKAAGDDYAALLERIIKSGRRYGRAFAKC